ncbi:chromosome condensation regulator RCC1 [Paenibacillus sp. 7541]|uniref:Chromosome condensation regulator RCC1 n=1 Tax=Paenibacillus campinasensis TaxID=66347 RepID=A0ABW9T2X8_9BACL|nr:chromosome condensation regulator RCC1 [Paenibacillus campinasensis]PAK55679.1 chromosome condensation regulator RCC1 [Paenibacillus sp. 7541]
MLYLKTAKHWAKGVLAVLLAVTVGSIGWKTHAQAAPTVQPVSAAGGNGHGVAAWSDGSVTAWGYNKFGQVGDGTAIHQFVPKTVEGLSDIIQVQAGGSTSFALNKDGEVWAWGDFYTPYMNGDAQLPFQKRGDPIQLTQLHNVKRLAYSEAFGSIVIHKDGTATLWYPSFRDHQAFDIRLTRLKGFSDVREAVMARYEAVVLDEDGNVGTLNMYNSFYDRYRTENELREVKPLASSIERIAVSYSDVFLLHSNGTVLHWNADSNKPPAAVKDVIGMKQIKEIKTGYQRLYMLKSDGTVWQWNYNTVPTAKPFQVKGLTGIKAIEGSASQTGYAVSEDGKLLAWGDGYYSGMGTVAGSQQLKGNSAAQVLPAMTWKVNGENVRFYASSAVIDGELYVPFTSVFQSLGVTTKIGQSNPDPKANNQRYPVISFSYKGKTIAVKKSNPPVLLVNGKATKEKLELPYLANSTMYPLELICEKLGIPLYWNQETGEVQLGESIR